MFVIIHVINPTSVIFCLPLCLTALCINACCDLFGVIGTLCEKVERLIALARLALHAYPLRLYVLMLLVYFLGRKKKMLAVIGLVCLLMLLRILDMLPESLFSFIIYSWLVCKYGLFWFVLV